MIFSGVIAALFALVPVDAHAQPAVAFQQEVGRAVYSTPTGVPLGLENVGVDEHLGAALPLDATFVDEGGQNVPLRSYVDGKRPVLLALVYHSCPSLCSMVLDGMTRTLREISWTVGNEFDVVALSIDPKDTVLAARKKKERVLERYARTKGARGWHFLVGNAESIERVTKAVGFRYFYDERQKQYAHPAVMILLTPEGRVARYLHGIDVPPADAKLGLLEAAAGRSMSTAEHVLLYCYQYDPTASGYVLMASRVMKVGGGATMILLGGFLTYFWSREIRRKRVETLDSALMVARRPIAETIDSTTI